MAVKQGMENILQDFILKLGLDEFLITKLTLKKVLHIGPQTCKKIELQPLKNVPWYFLQKLLSLNGLARSINPKDTEATDDPDFNIDDFFEDNGDESNYVHPLDVVCALLHCSESFLQQEIVSKMSMCQFAVPLLLPAGDGQECTFMLWAMRDIVKRWRPQTLAECKGFVEESLVNISIPIVSFVRLGECNLSKSNILNHVLSPEEQHRDYFVHKDMTGGNVRRVISDGLVEITWYFPGGEDSDLFPSPVAIANLRGDLQSNRKQFTFLTEVSSMVFVFIDNIDEESKYFNDIDMTNFNYFYIISLFSYNIIKGTFKTFLEQLSHFTNNNYLFIISKNDNSDAGKKTIEYLSTLFPGLNKRVIALNPRTSQDRLIAKKLKSLIKERTISNTNQNTLDELSHLADKIGIDVDENSPLCKKTKAMAHDITICIKDVADYKRHTMKLQGDLWLQLAKNEKEMCRMRKQGNRNGEDYRSQLNKANLDLRREQSQQIIPESIKNFQIALTDLSQSEKHYFLKWMRFYLDSISRNNVSQLQAQLSELKNVGQLISGSNLGIEHFLRELEQFYEAECSIVENGEMNLNQKQFSNLPGIAAELLLGGFPLELMDGDISNIPLQWITDVLTELDTKMGGNCRMRVITVLGVQSTGKSTLLNTMFGLQFPVASGRCTRGAFMTIINVEETFQENLGCDFILVIDTEGLKAPELASLVDSAEHDSELATLVVGLSDITIINVSMENTSEMKEILQVVVHAFIRMKQIGKKPNCQFVHQNVSDVSAQSQNLREKKLLLDQMDEMTAVAAKMEGYPDITKVSDIIEYDIEKHNWYIPGLWHGVPPMASISPGYSDKISELKRYLLDFLKQKVHSTSGNIKEFIEWIKSLWNAVKHEKFLFSFRNSLTADAYNQLCIEYSNLEWNFRKMVHSWMIETENQIKNQLSAEEETEMWMDLKNGIHLTLQAQTQEMEISLETYFESENKNVRLVESYKEDFMRSTSLLRTELEHHLNNKCKEVISNQKDFKKIRDIQGNYQKMIEEQVEKLLNKYRGKQSKLSNTQLKSEFDTMWNETFQTFTLSSFKKKNIGQLMLEHLRKDMKNKAGYINQKLINLNCLDKYQNKEFQLKSKYLEGKSVGDNKMSTEPEIWNEAASVPLTILDRCHRYVTEKLTTMQNYSKIFCQNLLDIINKDLYESVQRFQFKQFLELDLKLLVLGRAAPMFQKMHEDFIQNNDPKQCLEKLKPDYLNIFKQVYQEKDDCKARAQRFCKMCLKPAISAYVYSNLGKDIVDDVLMSEDSKSYGIRMFFQSALLKDLLMKKKCDDYVKYCLQYEIFAKNWIMKHITLRYKEPESLERLISTNLTSIINKVRQILEEQSFLQHTELSKSLASFCESLKKDLVMSQNDMNVVTFQSTANVHQFSNYVRSFLDGLKEELQTEIMAVNIESFLSSIAVKPQDELFKRVFGCGKQCPFCKVPCEAGGTDHKEHFAPYHRPQGLGGCRDYFTQILSHDLCSTDVISNKTFICKETNRRPHPFKEYQKIYEDWKIQPDPSIETSIYWKFIFKEFNEEFAKEYNAKPAELPEDWSKITREQALHSLEKY